MSTAPNSGHSERLAALINYVLFVMAPFTLGALAPAALIIAYSRRRRADPLVRGHYDYQIRSFWLDLIVLGLGAVFGWGALVGGIGAALSAAGAPLPGRFDATEVGIGALVLAALCVLCWLWGLLGLILGSVAGAMRLASGRPAVKTRTS